MSMHHMKFFQEPLRLSVLFVFSFVINKCAARFILTIVLKFAIYTPTTLFMSRIIVPALVIIFRVVEAIFKVFMRFWIDLVPTLFGWRFIDDSRVRVIIVVIFILDNIVIWVIFYTTILIKIGVHVCIVVWYWLAVILIIFRCFNLIILLTFDSCFPMLAYSRMYNVIVFKCLYFVFITGLAFDKLFFVFIIPVYELTRAHVVIIRLVANLT